MLTLLKERRKTGDPKLLSGSVANTRSLQEQSFILKE